MATEEKNEAEKAFAKVISVKVQKTGKELLQPFLVNLPAGKITAIMGPSGSGKTTFLNFLTGNVSGGIEAFGEIELSGTRSFVPQEDRLHGFYTVQQYMEHYCQLTGSPVKQDKIDSILEDLGLIEHKNTIVGDIFRSGLSGGQKRRLSVALECLSDPNCLFLDEPTSGLDAESAYQLVKFLHKYASGPDRRVILTIHQPNSFLWALLDNIILLSKGFLVYGGSRKKIEGFFSDHDSPTPSNFNPSDHYCAVINDEFDTEGKKGAEEWAGLFEAWKGNIGNVEATAASEHSNSSRRSANLSPRGSALKINIARRSTNDILGNIAIDPARGSALQATVAITKRSFMNLYKNPGILGTRIAMYSMLSLMIGALFWNLGDNQSYSSAQSRIALSFYCVAFFVFMSVAVLPFTVLERGIIDKETRNGYYHPIVYQIAQVLVSAPTALILSGLTSLITVSMVGFRNPLEYWLNMFLALFCAESLAIFVSYVVPHFIIGIAGVAGIYGFFMILQGFMIIPSEFPGWLEWSYYIAFHTYSWRSFMYNEFHGDDVVFDSVEFPTGDSILQLYEIEDVNPTNDMIILLCYGLFIHFLSVVVVGLKWLVHKAGQV